SGLITKSRKAAMDLSDPRATVTRAVAWHHRWRSADESHHPVGVIPATRVTTAESWQHHRRPGPTDPACARAAFAQPSPHVHLAALSSHPCRAVAEAAAGPEASGGRSATDSGRITPTP